MTKKRNQVKAGANVREMSNTEFMKKYGRLVYHCIWKQHVKKMKNIEHDTGLDIEDLTQFGMIGLIKARDNFDMEYGCEFSTYAVPIILGEIGRVIRDYQKVKVQQNIYSIKGEILRENLEDKTPEEIASILQEDVSVISNYIINQVHSL
ncbi:sigma-70 family RNA polymerase sigma factor [Bacillus thuringiensis]|nr:sigma-70 family RNA polymerase sigma factor [Bacillus thuringiensis]MED2783502.1 sigma-70 family RNA polymerase sigma factor [Bacillus thuringiensis]